MLQQYYAFVFSSSSSSAQLCAVTLAQQVLSVSTKAAGRESMEGGAGGACVDSPQKLGLF